MAALFTEGKEVVIQPDAQRLKAHGMTPEQLEPLRSWRLHEGDWKIDIGGKTVDLAEVAELTVRDLVTKPFTVELLDGREVLIVPDASASTRYLVTGEDFERDVRQMLKWPFIEDPADTIALGGIHIPPGYVPTVWGRDRVRMSTGEPLKTLAKVEIRGKPGPQAAELARMLAVRRNLEAGLKLGEGTV